MDTLHILLDDWEQAALQELARARGIDPTTLARRLLAERIRRHCAPLCAAARGPSSEQDGGPLTDRIEMRLLCLFDE